MSQVTGQDAVRLEVLRHELTTVAEEMGVTMKRTARSLTAREGGDFSSALLNREGGLLAQGFANGVHLGSLVEIMRPLLKKFDGDLRDGDIIVTNDPYGGLSHLPDIAMVMPVFLDGELVGFAAMELHHTDIGGRFAGGMGIDCREIYEEGLLLPAVKLFEGGHANDAVFDIIRAAVRAPESVIGDLNAQAASCRRGHGGLRELILRYGVKEFARLTTELDRVTEQQMRKFISELADGVYRASEELEAPLGSSDDAQTPVRVSVEVRIHGDRVEVDFAGSAAQVASAINVPVGLTKSVSYIVFRALCGGEMVANSGLVRPIEVHAPLGTVVNPRYPAAVGARGMLTWRLVDLLLRAMADAAPDLVPAAGDGGVNAMVYSGREGPVLVDWHGSGWGARPMLDGVDGVSNIMLGGTQFSLPAELIEREFPVVLTAFELVPDTEGTGEFRGALSLRRAWRFLEPGTVFVRSCRTTSRSYGLRGGGQGGANEVLVVRADGRTEELTGLSVECQVEPGDTVIHTQPGGGGIGDPRRRASHRIASDVLAGKISRVRAAEVYGYDGDDKSRPEPGVTSI
jgi:N-methylhydantoinase B